MKIDIPMSSISAHKEHQGWSKTGSESGSIRNDSTVGEPTHGVALNMNTLGPERFTPPRELEMVETYPSNISLHHARTFDLQSEDRGVVLLYRHRSENHALAPIDIIKRTWTHEIAKRWSQYSYPSIQPYIQPTETNSSVAAGDSYQTIRKPEPHEFYRLIGVRMLMGQLRGLRLREYWSDATEGSGRTVNILHAIQRSMTYKRYTELHKFTRFSDYSDTKDPHYDERLDWLLEDVFANSREMYNPTQCVTLDDQSAAFFGRSRHKKGPRNRKTDRYAIPSDELADMRGFTLGLRLQIQRECSEQQHLCDDDEEMCTKRHSFNDDISEKNKDTLHFIEESLGYKSGFELFSDREYTNYVLFDELFKKGISATGTIRTNWCTNALSKNRGTRKDGFSLSKGKKNTFKCKI